MRVSKTMWAGSGRAMRTRGARMRWAVALTMAMTLALGGCTTTGTTTKTPTVRINPVIAQASLLARNHDALNGQAKVENARAIERLLGGLDNAALTNEAAALQAGDPLYNFAGRELLRRGLALPRPFDREGGDWRVNMGDRPPADRDGYRPPRKLAVLLPLSGNLATAASPVRDGFLAGYYGEHRARPDVAFYDTTGTPAGTVAAYQKAVTDGADYVLGPLGRDEVGALFKESLTVPVLALNRGPVAPPSGNASFSLAPEDDGIAAAEYLISRNARRVVVLVGGDDNLRRSVAAFREHLQGRGGVVVETLQIADKPVDSTAALQAAMQKDGGANAVFLALKGTQARAIAPQLTAAGFADKLRVATSQLLSGSGKADQDKALDGIAFPTESWSVRGVSGLPGAEITGKDLPTARGPAAKLFAFGYDAWLLTGYLERIAQNANGKVQGATGTLRIDGFGNILRTPAWSTFRDGVLVALDGSGG
ncbi:MAG: penicillin-binding protein activator [Xanthomonadaceae bacterium]|nr:penicillin-binding protein activator [Xanthomonadaceae bacterium]